MSERIAGKGDRKIERKGERVAARRKIKMQRERREIKRDREEQNKRRMQPKRW